MDCYTYLSQVYPFKKAIIHHQDLIALRDKNRGERLCFTSGCFDLLHSGHLYFLHEAKKLGSTLVVGLNSDKSVKAIKGEHRPIIDEKSRLLQLAALCYVDYVFLFDERAAERYIQLLQPDVVIMGEDSFHAYPGEVAQARAIGAEIYQVSRRFHHSSTHLLSQIVEHE